MRAPGAEAPDALKLTFVNPASSMIAPATRFVNPRPPQRVNPAPPPAPSGGGGTGGRQGRGQPTGAPEKQQQPRATPARGARIAAGGGPRSGPPEQAPRRAARGFFAGAGTSRAPASESGGENPQKGPGGEAARTAPHSAAVPGPRAGDKRTGSPPTARRTARGQGPERPRSRPAFVPPKRVSPILDIGTVFRHKR